MLVMIKLFVAQKDVVYNHSVAPLLFLIAALAINSMFLLVLLIDVATWIYQEVYFSILKIPKIKRSRFVVISRHKLPGLSVVQKWSCWYCEYTNCVLSWAKAVANQTEIYSCAVKYSHPLPGTEYQAKFFEQKEFYSSKK